jgi:hypothetical protein
MGFVRHPDGIINSAVASDRAYVLARLRCLALRARVVLADIDAVGLALKGGLITPQQAITILDDEVEPRFDELPAVEAAE